ncbi:hypothetical protein SRHO_G00303000 [Serrasalmus rhombeus]
MYGERGAKLFDGEVKRGAALCLERPARLDRPVRCSTKGCSTTLLMDFGSNGQLAEKPSGGENRMGFDAAGSAIAVKRGTLNLEQVFPAAGGDRDSAGKRVCVVLVLDGLFRVPQNRQRGFQLKA